MNTQTKTSVKGALTSHKPGSMIEAWGLMYPMMLTAFSMSLMMFADRLILALYSTKAMTAATTASMAVFTVSVSLVGIAGIAETFVGQHNGARDYKRVGEPVWQMLWFCLMSFSVCLPLAYYGAELLVVDPFDDLGVPYFKWLMYFLPLFPASVVFASFFIGLGMPKIVTIVTILANIINIGLDYGMVLGIEGFLEPMGTAGAAIATTISKLFEVGVMGALFLQRKYHLKYNTRDFKFKFKPFWDCLKIGTPSSVSHMLELSAWTVMMHIMARASEVHVTVLAVGQSIFLLFIFISDGMSKGIGAIVSNYMGAKNMDIIPKTFAASFKILCIFMGLVFLIFAFFNYELVHALVEGDYPPDVMAMIIYYSRWSLVLLGGFLFFDGLTWLIIGILTAAGDTKFVMVCNGLSAWIFGILPLLIMVTYFNPNPVVAWSVIMLYGVGNFCIFYWRYKSGSWRVNRIRKER